MSGKTTNTLTAQITATDDTSGNVPINFGTGNPAFDSSVAEMVRYQSLAGATNPVLPISPCFQLYVKNLDAAKNITVSTTPTGGTTAVLVVLNPGDQIIIWGNPAGGVGGFTAFGLTPSAAGALCEYFLGG